MREASREGRQRGSRTRVTPRRPGRQRGRAAPSGDGSASTRTSTTWRPRSTSSKQRLGRDERRRRSGAVHVQTDDEAVVERAVQKYLPRIGRSASTTVSSPGNGWTRVDDELATASRRRCAGSRGSSRLALGAIVLTLGSRRARSFATSSGTAAGSSTSTLRAGALRAAAAGRRDRAGGEPDRRRAADRRRPGQGAGGCPDGRDARRAAAAGRASRAAGCRPRGRLEP